ncbi:MAG: BamA/TamA family outer membrane protein [Rikenellaceae bacterium]|nr:BamA/TamA family outer membrane protein [Rikenellaceae bacterium]
MKRLVGILSVCAVVMALLSGCGVTRRIPEGEYLLAKNIVEIDKSAPKNERVPASDIEEYIHQKPNKKVLGINFGVWLYAQANPDKQDAWNNFLRRVGEEPVYFDLNQTENSAKNIRTYLFSRGFFNATEDYRIDTIQKRKRVKVTYSGKQNTPYRIGKISYDFRDPFLENIILDQQRHTLLKSGEIYNDQTLDDERTRIADYLKNIGYYGFNVSNITYEADSTVGNHTVDLTMVVHPRLTGYNDNGSPRYASNSVYRIRNINVFPNYDPTISYLDSTNRARLDTVQYRGLNIIYDGVLRMRPKVLSNNIKLTANNLYDNSLVDKTYANLISLGNYRSVNVLFEEENNIGHQTQVTYIGSDSLKSTDQTNEAYLTCNILGTQTKRNGFLFEIEGSTTSTFYGLRATVGYQNKNLFRGSEMLDVSLSAGYEFLKSGSKRTSYEMGGAVGLEIPRFLLLGNIDRSPNVNAPRTRVAVSVNQQDRVYYQRTLSTINWAYNWNNGVFSTFTVRPIDWSLIKMGHLDESFKKQLKNPYLINSYTSQLIAGISGQFVFNNQVRNINGDAVVVRANVETAGNLVDGLSHLFGKPSAEGVYKLFGIPYSQYVRGDVNFSQKFVLGKRSSMAYRLYAGAGYSYGNASSLPFDRLFFSGGANSMRGWAARTLGPGGSPQPTDVDYPIQFGNMKLEANLEYRFKIWSMIHGAAFADVGNVWFLSGRDTDDPAAVFRLDSFYKQLGFDAGLGLRLDITFAILRLDWGVQIHNPNWPEGQRWIHDFKWKNMALNFGVGYPF